MKVVGASETTTGGAAEFTRLNLQKSISAMVLKKVMMEVGADKVAVVTINNLPVNSLSNAVYNGLYKCFKEIQEQNDIKAIVLTGANGKFCGGADIRGFQKKQNAEEESEKVIIAPLNLFNKVIEACERPVVAAIEGFALGGGLELAMVCHARVAAKGAKLGMPELQLGIMPGLGGTQRLPRLIGLDRALDMLLTSRSISAEDGREYGLVDIVTHSSDMLPTARRQALAMVSPKKSWLISLHRTDKIGNSDHVLRTLTKARDFAKRMFRNVSYPFICLDVVEEGLFKGGEIGTELENQTCSGLVNTFEARSLMHLFFSQRSALKVLDVASRGLKVRTIKSVAVVGSGLMGSGMATTFVAHNISVLLKDISSTILEHGINMIKENLEGLVKKGKMTELQAREALGLVKTTESYNGFEALDLVVESVQEDLPLKQRIFHDLESVCSTDCILASNTSGFEISTIGENLSHQGRIIGAHFFSPAHIMQLVEIVRGDQTSAQTVMDLLSLAKKLNKVPLIVNDVPGFAANRLFVPYLIVSTFLADLGLDPYRIDALIKDFGMPMGPFRVADFTGIKTFHLVSQTFFAKSPETFHRSPLIELLLRDSREGISTRKGFYNYRNVKQGEEAPELKGYLEVSRQIAKVRDEYNNIEDILDTDIIEMIFFCVANEACKVIEDNVVTGPTALDVASVFGMGFPSYRGGIIFWADSKGPVYILKQLKKWWQQYGDIYKPSSLLEKCAASNTPLGKVVSSPSKL